MRKWSPVLVIVCLIVGATSPVASSAAGPFSPDASYEFCREGSGETCSPDYYAGAIPEFRVHIEQDEGEEELASVVLKVPAGFRFPADRRIEDNELVGTVDLLLGVGPRCEGAVGSTMVPFEDRPIYERDRTNDEVRRGVHVIFVVELTPVIKLQMKVFGNATLGYRVRTAIPDEPFSCPPLVFDAYWLARSESTSTPILRLPRTPGSYALAVIFTSTSGAKKRIVQRFDII